MIPSRSSTALVLGVVNNRDMCSPGYGSSKGIKFDWVQFLLFTQFLRFSMVAHGICLIRIIASSIGMMTGPSQVSSSSFRILTWSPAPLMLTDETQLVISPAIWQIATGFTVQGWLMHLLWLLTLSRQLFSGPSRPLLSDRKTCRTQANTFRVVPT